MSTGFYCCALSVKRLYMSPLLLVFIVFSNDAYFVFCGGASTKGFILKKYLSQMDLEWSKLILSKAIIDNYFPPFSIISYEVIHLSC